MNPLGALLAQMVGAKKYTPKFCRVRGCNLKHGHKGDHGRSMQHGRGVPVAREVADRGRGSSVGPVAPRRAPRHVNATLRGHLARQRMAEIRAGGKKRDVAERSAA